MNQPDFIISFESAPIESPEIAELVSASNDYQKVKEDCDEIDTLLELSEQMSMPMFWYYSST